LRVGCPIRRSRDQRLLASPPGLSQRATPFIASQCQGIHQMPFLRSFPDTASAASDKTRHSQGQKPPRGSPIRGRRYCPARDAYSREDTLPQRQVNIPPRPSPPASNAKANETPASVTLSSPCQRTLPKALTSSKPGSSTIAVLTQLARSGARDGQSPSR
jgi:hypothetical protein